jgi:hypothetical protein
MKSIKVSIISLPDRRHEQMSLGGSRKIDPQGISHRAVIAYENALTSQRERIRRVPGKKLDPDHATGY